MFGNAISSVDDLLSHITFRFREDHEEVADEKLFMTALIRYLRGEGHVMHDYVIGLGIVPEREYEEELRKPLARVKRFLRYTTGAELPPGGPWHMSVRMSHEILQVNVQY